jgi:plasmid stabilization system protein ParE
VVWREDAETELADLYMFIIEERGLPQTAREYVHEIVDRCEDLADLPFAGRARDEILPGLRSVAFKSVVIFYFVDAHTVTITNIMHRARDYERLLRGERPDRWRP